MTAPEQALEILPSQSNENVFEGSEDEKSEPTGPLAPSLKPRLRFGLPHRRRRRKKMRLFPSSLRANCQRAEAIFTRYLRDPPAARKTVAPEPQQPPAEAQPPPPPPSPPENKEETPGGKDSEPARRATRSTGKADEWVKVPMEANVKVAPGAWKELEGVVYLSLENGQLYKQHGRVYFEAMYLDNLCKYYVPEENMPMVTEDHPRYREELYRLEEERARRVSKVTHMLELIAANEQASADMEEKAASKTLELRREELKERMLERLEDELEDLQEELEETEAVQHLEAMAIAAGRGVKRKAPSPCPPPPPAPPTDPPIDAVVSENDCGGGVEDAGAAAAVNGVMGYCLGPEEAMFEVGKEEERGAEGEEGLVEGEGPAAGVAEEGAGEKKKPKIRAVDLAVKTLAIASDVHRGLSEVGLVHEDDYRDIDDIVVEKLYPDEDYGSDEDLVL